VKGSIGPKASVAGSRAQLPAVLLDQRLGRFQQPLPIRTLGTRFAHPTIGYLLHLGLPALDLALGDVIDAARGQARAHFGFCIGEDASDLAGQRDAAVRIDHLAYATSTGSGLANYVASFRSTTQPSGLHITVPIFWPSASGINRHQQNPAQLRHAESGPGGAPSESVCENLTDSPS